MAVLGTVDQDGSASIEYAHMDRSRSVQIHLGFRHRGGGPSKYDTGILPARGTEEACLTGALQLYNYDFIDIPRRWGRPLTAHKPDRASAAVSKRIKNDVDLEPCRVSGARQTAQGNP